MTKLLETSSHQYYFKKILQIVPPKNDLQPLYLSDQNDEKPLILVTYEGVLGTDLNSPASGLE